MRPAMPRPGMMAILYAEKNNVFCVPFLFDSSVFQELVPHSYPGFGDLEFFYKMDACYHFDQCHPVTETGRKKSQFWKSS